MGYLNHSRKAQAVLPAFHDSDIIVYIESGERGQDRFFWEKIFKKFCSNKKVTFSPKGGKGEVLAILEKGIADNNFVAIDRDLDDIFKSPYLKDNKNLIYTWGYSYENDMYSLDSVFNIIRVCFSLSVDKEDETKQNLEERTKSFIEQIAPYMCSFAEGLREGKNVYPNPKSKSFDRLFNCGSFSLNLKEVKKCIKSLKLKKNCCDDGKHAIFKDIRYCNGHLLETFFCHLVNSYIVKGKKINKDDLKRLAFMSFEKFLTPKVNKYYKKILANINDKK